MLVGHNPGLADVANHLVGHGADFDLLRISAKFPTAGLATLEFDVDALARRRSPARPSSPASPRPTTPSWRRSREARGRALIRRFALRSPASGRRASPPLPLGYRTHTSQLEILLRPLRPYRVLGVKAAPASRVARFTRKPYASARLRLLAFMRLCCGSRPAGRLPAAKTMDAIAASERRSHREAGEAQRSSREAA